MIFEKENTVVSLGPLALLLTAGGMERSRVLEIRASEDAAVLLKREMTAMELVRSIRSLKTLASELLVRLKKTCGSCKHCEENCPYLKEPVQIPEVLLERAGIPKTAKLDVFAEDGEIYIAEAEGPDLRDVPPDMLELFRQTGICLDRLDGLLMEGGVVYDG